MQLLIVDDEPLAQEVLESYVHKIEGLTIAGICSNALEAFSALNHKHVDLMLLDINMPEISGLDFLRSLKNPPPVIFTTAYSEFAVASYDVEAIDYLVKPIPFDRFLKAIRKVQERTKPLQPAVVPAGNEVPILFVRSEGRLIRIDFEKIWFVESLKDYVRFWTDTGKIVVHSTMKNIAEQLSGKPAFVRISKSYVVNLHFVHEIDGHSVRIKDQSIAIGSTYRDAVHELFSRYKLL